MNGLFRRVLDRTPQAIFVSLAETGAAVDINQTGLEWLGYSHDEFLVLGIGGVLRLCPDKHKSWDEELAKLRQSKGSLSFPIAELRRKDGSALLIALDVTLHSFEGVDYVVGVARDITGEQQIRDDLHLTQLAVDSSTIAMFRVSKQAAILWANPAACLQLGYPKDEIETMRVFDFDPDYNPEIWPEHWEAICAKGRLVIQTRHKKKTGEIFPVEVSINHIPAGRFHDEHLCSFVRDLSRPREIEQQLRQADRITTIGTLAAGVAHEINNPLQYVLLSLEELSGSQQLDPLGRELLEDAEEGCRRIRDIVAGLQALSRNGEEEVGTVSIHESLDFALKIASSHYRHRAVLRQERSKQPLYVGAVRGQAGQVFLNLIVNAAQAFEQPHPDNEIIVRTKLSESNQAVIEISDNGVGIPTGIIDRVFDAFFTTKAQGVGTGLGLAISHSIVRGLGGEMKIESTLGEGTTVRVTIPAVDGPTTSAESEPALGQRKILIVDDDVRIAKAFARHLSDMNVTTCAGGQEALSLLREHDFEVVLCDVMMPGLTGPELYKLAIAGDERWKERFVFMSGGACTSETQSFLSSTTCPYLAKPISTHELRRTLAEFESAE